MRQHANVGCDASAHRGAVDTEGEGKDRGHKALSVRVDERRDDAVHGDGAIGHAADAVELAKLHLEVLFRVGRA
jgi:hypothetical protein